MAGIKQPLQSVLAKIATMQVTNGDGSTFTAYARVWNNQVAQSRDGKQYDFPKPAIFVEIINNVAFEQLGVGFKSADLGFNIHIVHEQYDAGNGTFEQDITVFDLRDKIVSLLSRFFPTACSALMCTGESQDYDHDNLYHYIVSFVCNFIDSKGSGYDAGAGEYTESEPPTTLNLVVAKANKPVFNPHTYKPKLQ